MSKISRRALARESALTFSGTGVLLGSSQAQTVTPEASTTLDAKGTVHISRSIPVPATLSAEAQTLLATGKQWAPDGWTAESAELLAKAKSTYPATIEEQSWGGVKVKLITPKDLSATKQRRLLINLHGGGFTSDSGSLLESIPIASLTSTRVVTVDYRLAPKHPFPAAVEDAVAVYSEALKKYQPAHVGVFGTSAGAILTAQMAVQARKSSLRLPAVLGFFSGYADFTKNGDSRSFYGVNGLIGFKPADNGVLSPAYIGKHDPKDPVVSPIYADLRGFPPTLCMTGTRDSLLSGTVNFHRALLRAGVDAQLIVFDAMPHAHWYSFHLPESREALEAQARFLDLHLS